MSANDSQSLRAEIYLHKQYCGRCIKRGSCYGKACVHSNRNVIEGHSPIIITFLEEIATSAVSQVILTTRAAVVSCNGGIREGKGEEEGDKRAH